MQQEQYTPPAFDQSPRQAGTIFEDGDNIGIDIGEIARQKKIASALADVTAATQSTAQPTVETVEKRLEYVPLPQEIVHRMGIKIRGLRKLDSENNIKLFDDSELTAPYLYSPENGQVKYTTKTWNTTEQAQGSPQENDSKEASWKGFHEQSF